MSNNKKTSKTSTEEKVVKTVAAGIPVHGVGGVLLFVVCISIGYNVFLVLTGTEGLLNQVMAAPSILFIVAFLLYKAWK